MQYTHLGRSGLLVSRLCLGTMNFGSHCSKEESFRIMDHALDQGINFFDTANAYGGKLGEGITEQIIGQWFEQGGGRREKVVLATKVYGDMGYWPNSSKLSAVHIRRACEESLRRLQTDHVDLYQMHHIDRQTPWDEIWQALEQLVREGKIVYTGSSNFAGWHIAQAQETAKSRHFMGLVSEQSLYNLNSRTIELEVIPVCKSYGIGLIPWSPLGGGLLGGILKRTHSMRRTESQVQKVVESNTVKLEAYEEFCASLDIEPTEIALAWLLNNPTVTAPIVGPRNVEQLSTALKSIEINLTVEMSQKLDEIFPGPGGVAPEAYAW